MKKRIIAKAQKFSIPEIKTCPECGGSGFVTSPRYSTLGQNTFITRWKITCPKCKGKGIIFEEVRYEYNCKGR